jgi:ABC-type siderophore export system fused ATPase/permease subunit
LYDIVLSLIGVSGWMIVGLLWKDRALILLNGVGIIFFVRTLLADYVFA